MVEIKHLVETGDPIWQYNFPESVKAKRQAVAILDFTQFDSKTNVSMFRKTQERGSFTLTTQESYQHFLDTLDNKELQKQRWEQEVGTLYIVPNQTEDDTHQTVQEM